MLKRKIPDVYLPFRITDKGTKEYFKKN